MGSRFWMRVSLFSFWVVALLGVLMRYKIAFYFPWFNQKNLQYGHAHFAFAGWITQTIYLLLWNTMRDQLDREKQRAFRLLLLAHWLVALSMLVSFAAVGYAPISIVFSALSIGINVCCLVFIWPNLKYLASAARPWISAALVFQMASVLGTASLGFMMISKHLQQELYLASLYWYLHFQYNGWFLFAIVGLWVQHLSATCPQAVPPKWTFWMMALATLPAYGLSVLWYKLPTAIYAFVVAGALVQFIGWLSVLGKLPRLRVLTPSSNKPWLLVLGAIALVATTIKMSLQLASVVPAVSQLAFGFRPIVIAYLHLVLLGMVTCGLLCLAVVYKLIVLTKWIKLGLGLFVFGFMLNETVLGIQGVAAFSYTPVHFANPLLLVAAFTMATGVGILFLAPSPVVKPS